MKYIQSDKGYTLLLTLVLVVLLIMITTTFTMASMNQAKQVVKTDNSIVATSLAEMGVEYYNEAILRIIKNQQSKTIEFINNNPTLTQEEVDSLISNARTNTISEINSLIAQPSPFNYTDKFYEISINENRLTTTGELNYDITGTLTTNSSSSEKKIRVSIIIPPDVFIDDQPRNPTSPSNNTSLKFKDFEVLDNWPLNYGSGTSGGNQESIFNETILAQNNVKLGQLDMGEFSDSTIMAGNSIEFVYNKANGYKVFLYSSEINFSANPSNKHTKFIESYFYTDVFKSVKKNTGNKNSGIVLDKSFICIRSSTGFDENDPDAFTFTNGSKIYIYNNGENLENINSNIVYLNKADFMNKCNATSDNSIKGSEKKLDFISDLSYIK